ncbi:MAG: DUF2461 domain-containing protein [Oscillospiraceae bacterium]|nr:DUF2461 domain-containing protein [Oscillospiraceae bacterium]
MFQGFSPETVDFLWGIRLNNNREWFEANKKNYVKYLYEPMKELGKYLYEPFLDQPGTLMKVSRIYKDARMHPVVPYKESLWICIRRDVQWWGENPCQYLEINPDGIDYGMFFWQPRVAKLAEFRAEIARDPDTFLALVEQAERDTGVRITAAEYKRPKPCPDPRLERFYRWKGKIGCVRTESFSDATFCPELADRARDFITALTPLTNYLSRFGTE